MLILWFAGCDVFPATSLLVILNIIPTNYDGLCSAGMTFSLQSRDVIAGSIETVMGGQWYDANITISACDKSMLGGFIVMGRITRPSIMVSIVVMTVLFAYRAQRLLLLLLLPLLPSLLLLSFPLAALLAFPSSLALPLSLAGGSWSWCCRRHLRDAFADALARFSSCAVSWMLVHHSHKSRLCLKDNRHPPTSWCLYAHACPCLTKPEHTLSRSPSNSPCVVLLHAAGGVHGAGSEPGRPALRRRACTGGGEEVPDEWMRSEVEAKNVPSWGRKVWR